MELEVLRLRAELVKVRRHESQAAGASQLQLQLASATATATATAQRPQRGSGQRGGAHRGVCVGGVWGGGAARPPTEPGRLLGRVPWACTALAGRPAERGGGTMSALACRAVSAAMSGQPADISLPLHPPTSARGCHGRMRAAPPPLLPRRRPPSPMHCPVRSAVAPP
jgi:hypothetical protein